MLVRLLSEHQPFQQFVERLYGMLVGNDDGPEAQVRLAALTCVVGGTVAHPLVAHLDDDTLRSQLLDMVRRLWTFRRRQNPDLPERLVQARSVPRRGMCTNHP